MSGFVATAALPPAGDMLINDGWFPDVSLESVRDIVRIDGTVTPARLRDVIRHAVIHVNCQLAGFKARHAAAATLASVQGDEIDGVMRLELLYMRAVAHLAKAELIERYRDLDSTGSGLRRAIDMEPSIDEHRRNARWAVRDILGEPRSVVELI
ncbi:MAG TPA: head completion/stabilization protein [Lysobacter sp.]